MGTEYKCIKCGGRPFTVVDGKHYCFTHGAEEKRRLGRPVISNWIKVPAIFGGIMIILMVVSILMLQPMNPNSDDIINTDISGDRNIVIIGDGNIITSGNTEQSEFVRINPATSALLLELQQEKILEQEQRIKDLEKSLADITDENERMKLGQVIDRLKLANNLMQEQDFAGAETHYRLILSNNEIDPEALEGLSLALARQDKFEESIFYYNKVLALEPDSYEAIINNAWSFAMLEEYEQSLKMLNDLEIKDPDDLLVLSHKCWVLHKLDLHESARETCKKVLAHGTDDERVAKAYSLSLSFLNRFEEALPFHKKLYELYPNDFPTLVNYANTLSNVGQVQNALIIYDEGLEKFPNSEVLQHNKKVLCVKNPHLDCSPS